MVLPDSPSLVPLPASIAAGCGSLALDADVRMVVEGEADAAASNLAAIIAERIGASLPLVTGAARAGDIVVRRTETGSPESYTLDVDDRITIAAVDAAGLFYGIQTLRQLLQRDGAGWVVPRCAIEDVPRFGFRGVMLDVARTFFDIVDVKAFIDRASAMKFNRLHLHLTDDQGWRLEIESRPRLTERASASSVSGRPGGFYTQDDYREIVAYAASRHMVVVPEVDLPGHTHAIGLAYPEIMAPPVLNDALIEQSRELGQPLPVAGEPYLGWGVGHSSVRIREDATYDFLRDVLGEVAALTPGPYLHIGGDEALGTPQADFDLFIERVTALTNDVGKTAVAWHEAGSARVAAGTIGQYWGNSVPQGAGAEETRRFAERGGAVILSPSNVAYLDQKYDADFPLGLTWAGLIDLRTAYEWEPTHIVPGLPDEAILGIEGPLWSETPESLAELDQLFFPRAAALAEIAWSPASAASPERTWDSFRQRVGAVGAVWDDAGWGGHRPTDIPWSTR